METFLLFFQKLKVRGLVKRFQNTSSIAPNASPSKIFARKLEEMVEFSDIIAPPIRSLYTIPRQWMILRAGFNSLLSLDSPAALGQ